MKRYLVVVILIVSFLFAGCTTQSAEQNRVPIEQTISKTIELESGDITYTDDKAHWRTYTNSYDHYRIYHPNDWIEGPMDSPYIEPSTDIYGTITQMRKQVRLFPPTYEGNYITSGNGEIIITGYTYANPNKTYTPKQLNDKFSSHFASQMQKEKSVTNVQIDSNEYLINGNPATHLTFDALDGMNTYENFQIVHDYSFYNLQWAGNKSYASTASKIMRTFEPY
jgi:hypothetical protein